MSGPERCVVMALAAHVDNAAAYLAWLSASPQCLTVSLFFGWAGPGAPAWARLWAPSTDLRLPDSRIAVQLVWDGVADFKDSRCRGARPRLPNRKLRELHFISRVLQSGAHASRRSASCPEFSDRLILLHKAILYAFCWCRCLRLSRLGLRREPH